MHPPTREGKYANFFSFVSVSFDHLKAYLKHTATVRQLGFLKMPNMEQLEESMSAPWKRGSVKWLINNLIKLGCIKSRGVGYYTPINLCGMAKLKPGEGLNPEEGTALPNNMIKWPLTQKIY